MDQSNEFQNSEMLQKVRAGKVDEKNIPSTAKKRYIKAISVYASERSRHAHSNSGVVYCAMR